MTVITTEPAVDDDGPAGAEQSDPSASAEQAPAPEPTPTPSRSREWVIRLVGRTATDRFWGWMGPMLVTLIGGFLRFWHLDRPPALNFDEAYYVRQAGSMIKYGFEMRWIDASSDKAVTMWNAGNTAIWTHDADFVVHPPLGKWMIAVGELLLGQNNRYGWRFSVAFCGTLSILMLGRIARRLFSSSLLGTTAALLLAVDGQHFTQSRTGLLDLFVMFWALAGFGCLLLDRDHSRRRLARRLEQDRPLPWWLPWTWLRPWRLAGAVCLGLCAGVKWSGLWFFVAFLLLSLLWDLGARRAAGDRLWWGSLVTDGAYSFLTTFPLAVATYLVTWTGWFLSNNAWDRNWADTHDAASGWGWMPGPIRGLWHYHVEAFRFHNNVHDSHPWMSNPWSWLVEGRPTMFWLNFNATGCGKGNNQCVAAVDNLGNPVIWWGATLAVGVLLFAWLLRRDWRAGAILAGFVGGYLPWFNWQSRTIFTFYAIAFTPWVVLALVYALGLILGPSNASPDRRMTGAVVAGTIVILAVMAFGYFYPIYADVPITHGALDARMWWPSWG